MECAVRWGEERLLTADLLSSDEKVPWQQMAHSMQEEDEVGQVEGVSGKHAVG